MTHEQSKYHPLEQTLLFWRYFLRQQYRGSARSRGCSGSKKTGKGQEEQMDWQGHGGEASRSPRCGRGGEETLGQGSKTRGRGKTKPNTHVVVHTTLSKTNVSVSFRHTHHPCHPLEQGPGAHAIVGSLRSPVVLRGALRGCITVQRIIVRQVILLSSDYFVIGDLFYNYVAYRI